ncbi:hypothetical protein KI387_019617, partial [Taxus chinensis]
MEDDEEGIASTFGENVAFEKLGVRDSTCKFGAYVVELKLPSHSSFVGSSPTIALSGFGFGWS